jgi:hypothetical protein
MRLHHLQILVACAVLALLAALVHAPRPHLARMQSAARAHCIQQPADRITAAACAEIIEAASHYGSNPP